MMKKLIYLAFLISPILFFAQQSENDNKCQLPSDYKEPKPDKKIQGWLRRGDATIEDLRKHIALENDVDLSNVIFLRISEQKGNGIYSACISGKEMKYKRMGTVFMKNSENPFDTAK